MSMYGEEEVVVGLDKDVFSEVAGLNSQDVSGISDSNAAENAVKESFAAWKMFCIVGAVWAIIAIAAFIMIMCTKKKAEDESRATPVINKAIKEQNYVSSFLSEGSDEKNWFLDSDSDSDPGPFRP